MPNLLRPSAALTVAIVFGWLMAAAPAHAEDTAAAREHYQKGTAFFDLGKYTDAIKEFEAAYEAKNDPAFLYNLAQSYRLAGNPEQALRFYRTYLRKNPKPPNRADIEEKIAQLEKLVDQKTATQTSPPTHTIQPTLPGVQNPGGPSVPSLPPAPPVTTAPPAAPPPGPPSEPATPPPPSSPPNLSLPPGQQAPYPTTPPPPPSVPENKGTSALRITGWIVGAAGVTSLIVGAAYGQAAKNAAKEIQDYANNSNNKMFTPALEAVDQRGRTDQTLEFVFLGVGAAALAGGVVCYFMGASPESATAGGHVSFLPTVSPNGGSASMRVTF